MAGSQGFHLTRLGNGNALLEPQHAINPGNPDESLDAVLRAVKQLRVSSLYYDLSEVTIIDPVYYAFLNRLASGCHALGVVMICINMQPSAAYALAGHLTRHRALRLHTASSRARQ